MKRFTTIFLLTIIFFQTFSSLAVRMRYVLNQDYIARVLCINKEKPKMKCNGKCFLAKQLKEQEKKEEQSPNSKHEPSEVQMYFLPDQIITGKMLLVTHTVYPFINDGIITSYRNSVFHPPSA